MKKSEIPREYRFYQGSFKATSPYVTMHGPRPIASRKPMSRSAALILIHKRAATYKRPFNIEVELCHPDDEEQAVQILLASRGNNAISEPYAYVFRAPYASFRYNSIRSTFKNYDLMIEFLEFRLSQYFVGDTAAMGRK